MVVSVEAPSAAVAPAELRRDGPRLVRKRFQQLPFALLLLLPALLIIGTFHFFPLFYAFFISLRNWGIVDQGMVWLKNYNAALHARDFWQALGTTVYYVLGTVPVTMALACIIAYLLFQK